MTTLTSRTMGSGQEGLVNTHTLRMGDGRQIVVNPNEKPPAPPPPPIEKATSPNEEVNVENLEEPKLEPFNSTSIVATLINVRVTKGLKTTPDLKEDIWISDKIDTGSSIVVTVPEHKKPIRIVHRADWEEGIQRLVSMLMIPSGPLDPKLKGLLDDLIGTDEDESNQSS
tara:strand:+ start:1151 stop:1660 length:510 start_codon:yes stop_codon:yes gene_type:complete